MAWTGIARMRSFPIALVVGILLLAAAPQVQAQSPSPRLLFAAGSGNLQTEPFTSSGSIVTVCWTVSGQSPSDAFGPSVAFFLKPTGGGPWGPEFAVEQAAQACTTAPLAAGTYIVNVVATPWTQWSLTITPT